MICWRASPLQMLCLQNCINPLTNLVFTFLILILCCCDSAYRVNFVSVCECKLNKSESTLMGHYSSRPEATLPGGVYVRARVHQSVHLSARLPSFKQTWLLRFHFVKLSNGLSLICAKSIKRNEKLTEETETVCLDSKSFFLFVGVATRAASGSTDGIGRFKGSTKKVQMIDWIIHRNFEWRAALRLGHVKLRDWTKGFVEVLE